VSCTVTTCNNHIPQLLHDNTVLHLAINISNNIMASCQAKTTLCEYQSQIHNVILASETP